MGNKNKKIAIGVSGSGTTFEAIANAIGKGDLELDLVFLFADRDCSAINKLEIDVVALAGYLRRFPVTAGDPYIVLNSHPGAIPYFGGKGMYGSHVHEAVLAWINKTEWVHPYTYSTVHIATAVYDQGQKLGIVPLHVEKSWNAKDIAEHLLPLEHQNYVEVLKQLSKDNLEAKHYPEDFVSLF
jgi:phosphoribosylglycinamide formyltransferase-1